MRAVSSTSYWVLKTLTHPSKTPSLLNFFFIPAFFLVEQLIIKFVCLNHICLHMGSSIDHSWSGKRCVEFGEENLYSNE